MNQRHDASWTPAPELLAAFVDGELDERPEMAALRSRVEQWLAAHPEAITQVEEQLELSRLMSATTPTEPSPSDWAKLLLRIEQGAFSSSGRRPWAVRFGGIAAACLAAAVVLGVLTMHTRDLPAPKVQRALQQPQGTNDVAKRETRPPWPAEREAAPSATAAAPPKRIEVLQVARAEEVEILRVSGADTGTVVIGQLPVSGPMLWLQPDEVEVTPPAAGDVRTIFRAGAGTLPMIWTLLPSETGTTKNDEEG